MRILDATASAGRQDTTKAQDTVRRNRSPAAVAIAADNVRSDVAVELDRGYSVRLFLTRAHFRNFERRDAHRKTCHGRGDSACRKHDVLLPHALDAHQFHRGALRFALARKDTLDVLDLLGCQAGLERVQHALMRALLTLSPFFRVQRPIHSARNRAGMRHETDARESGLRIHVLLGLPPLFVH